MPGLAPHDLVGCRTDPEAVLSDGTTIVASATIGCAVGNVTGVAWTLTIPTGVTVTASLATKNGPPETVSVSATGAANTYAVSCVVTTASGTNAVVLDGYVAKSGHVWSDQASGHNGDTLSLSVTTS